MGRRRGSGTIPLQSSRDHYALKCRPNTLTMYLAFDRFGFDIPSAITLTQRVHMPKWQRRRMVSEPLSDFYSAVIDSASYEGYKRQIASTTGR